MHGRTRRCSPTRWWRTRTWRRRWTWPRRYATWSEEEEAWAQIGKQEKREPLLKLSLIHTTDRPHFLGLKGPIFWCLGDWYIKWPLDPDKTDNDENYAIKGVSCTTYTLLLRPMIGLSFYPAQADEGDEVLNRGQRRPWEILNQNWFEWGHFEGRYFPITI